MLGAGAPVRQAVFLVGGKGTRLGALTQDTPKPLLEVTPGVRFLDVVLEEAARAGFTDILLLAGYLGDQVEVAYQGKRIRDATVTVMREPEPQGTGGALRFAAERLAPWFLMGNGDSLFEFNLRALAMDLHDGLTARLALREVPDPARYGAVTVEGARIARFHEKSPDLQGPALINGGVYVMSRDVLDLINGPCSIEQDVFPKLAAAGRLEGRRFDGYFLDMGLPNTYAQAQAEVPARRQRPCVFFDRDGVLNHDAGHTHKVEDLDFIDGAPEAVRAFNEAGWYVVVVTNQAGVAKGKYREEQVGVFHAAMADALAARGAHIDAFYHCPFHADAVVERYRIADHPDRKPNPGMVLRALEDWPIIRERSVLIGDQQTDLDAAAAAGVRGVRYDGGRLDALARVVLEQPKSPAPAV